jgi:MFS superfamily sulfate permease-like transporter
MMSRNVFDDLSRDLPAGIVVFLVALPLCLGVAFASGAPLVSGLIAGIIGGIFVALMSASPLSVSGPAAGMAVMVLSAIQDLGSFEGFLLAAFLAGALQVGLGLLGAGILGSIFPNAVIRGMLFAIGLILILKQLPHALGFGTDPLVDETYSPETPGFILDEISEAISSIAMGPFLVFSGAVAIIVIWDQLAKGRWFVASYIPGPLLAVLWGIGFEFFSRGTVLDLSSQHLVSLPVLQSLSHLFEGLNTPDFSQITHPEIAIHAVQIAVLASVETLLSIEALDRLDPLKRPTPRNRELIAQGFGNLLSASLGGLPITSVVVRSTTNLNAGARSRKAALIHGFLLLSSLMFLVTWINLIPLAVLAAILLVTGLRLAHPQMVITMWQRGRDQFIPFLVTILAILVDDLLKGVLIGSVVGLIFIIKSNFHSGITLTRDKNNYLIRFRKDATFLNKIRLRTLLDQIEPQSFVVIDGSRAEFMDRDILDCIADFGETARFREISVTLRNVIGISGPLCSACLDDVPSVDGCLHN